jgi:hypothetical protein
MEVRKQKQRQTLRPERRHRDAGCGRSDNPSNTAKTLAIFAKVHGT